MGPLRIIINAFTDLAPILALTGIRTLARQAAVVSTSFSSELVQGFHRILREPVLSGLPCVEVVFGVFQLNPAIITIVGHDMANLGVATPGSSPSPASRAAR